MTYWKEWNKFITRLKHVDELYVRRCIRPDDFWKISDISIHHFSDASEQGYGQCRYIRMVDEERQIHCSLLLGKSRVVPKKFVSIPRLEITAAVLSVKMACLLKKELNLGEVTHYFWIDNKVVVGIIQEGSKLLCLTEFIKSKKILMQSSGVTFQQEKIQQMMLQGT